MMLYLFHCEFWVHSSDSDFIYLFKLLESKTKKLSHPEGALILYFISQACGYKIMLHICSQTSLLTPRGVSSLTWAILGVGLGTLNLAFTSICSPFRNFCQGTRTASHFLLTEKKLKSSKGTVMSEQDFHRGWFRRKHHSLACPAPAEAVQGLAGKG